MLIATKNNESHANGDFCQVAVSPDRTFPCGNVSNEIISLHPVSVQYKTNRVLPSTYNNFNYKIMFCLHYMFQLNIAIFRCLSIDKLLSA
jgi:hypothetical protein